VRVTGGEFRGRPLHVPRGHRVRPTADMVREALFNIIGPAVADSRFLDLYAGSGAVGIEALSRGALRATFVERDHGVCRFLRRNLEGLGLGPERAMVCPLPVAAVLRRWGAAAAAERFDIVFADPPYGRDLLVPTMALLVETGVAAGGLVIAELSRREPQPSVSGLKSVRQRVYGDTVLVCYQA